MSNQTAPRSTLDQTAFGRVASDWQATDKIQHAIKAGIGALLGFSFLWMERGFDRMKDEFVLWFFVVFLAGAAFEVAALLVALAYAPTRQRNEARAELKVLSERIASASREREANKVAIAETAKRATILEGLWNRTNAKLETCERDRLALSDAMDGAAVVATSDPESDAGERLALAQLFINSRIHILQTRIFENRTSKTDVVDAMKGFSVDVGILLRSNKQSEWRDVIDISGWPSHTMEYRGQLYDLINAMQSFSDSLTADDVNSTWGQSIPGVTTVRRDLARQGKERDGDPP